MIPESLADVNLQNKARWEVTTHPLLVLPQGAGVVLLGLMIWVEALLLFYDLLKILILKNSPLN